MATIVTFFSGTRMKETVNNCKGVSQGQTKIFRTLPKDAVVSVRDHEQLTTILYILYYFYP